MLSCLCIFIASQFWLMSDRAHFWDPEKVSKHTNCVQESDLTNITLDSKAIEGKNILLLVHGYNNDPKTTLSTYCLINEHISAFKASSSSRFYDLIIGYLWPGNDSTLEYYDAKRHVSILAKKMRSHLEFFSASAAKVDVLAHSMGNLLMLEALNYHSFLGRKVVQNFYALAPAVDDESIEKKEKYYCSTQNCEKMFVFYSKQDNVLKWFYRMAEWDKALGYKGSESPDKLPENIELIDYTNFIGEHSQYFVSLPVYEFIKTQFYRKNLYPNSLKNRNLERNPIGLIFKIQ